MHAYATSTPYFVTSASAQNAEVRERMFLAEHLHHCNGARGRLFGLFCTAESLNVFFLPRIVTTLFIASMLLGAGASAL